MTSLCQMGKTDYRTKPASYLNDEGRRYPTAGYHTPRVPSASYRATTNTGSDAVFFSGVPTETVGFGECPDDVFPRVILYPIPVPRRLSRIATTSPTGAPCTTHAQPALKKAGSGWSSVPWRTVRRRRMTSSLRDRSNHGLDLDRQLCCVACNTTFDVRTVFSPGKIKGLHPESCIATDESCTKPWRSLSSMHRGVLLRLIAPQVDRGRETSRHLLTRTFEAMDMSMWCPCPPLESCSLLSPSTVGDVALGLASDWGWTASGCWSRSTRWSYRPCHNLQCACRTRRTCEGGGTW